MKKLSYFVTFVIITIALLFITRGTVTAADLSITGYNLLESGKCGKNVTFRVYGKNIWADDEDYKIIVSGTGSTYDYKDDEGAPMYYKWEMANGYFKVGSDGDLIIEKGITRIGKYLCVDIHPKSITLPEGLKSIGEGAFKSQSSLTSIKIPKTVTTIGAVAFYENSKLKSITIPGSVTSIGRGAFEFCDGLKTLSLGKGLKTIGKDAFEACWSLTSVNIPDSVTSLGSGAFQSCEKLKTARISASLTKLPYGAFSGSGLTKVIFPKNSKIKIIGSYCFSFCRDLKKITLPKSVKEIKGDAFSCCDKLRVITLLSKKPPKIKSKSVFDHTNTKKMTIKCPNMSKASNKKFRKQLKKIGYKGKVK